MSGEEAGQENHDNNSDCDDENSPTKDGITENTSRYYTSRYFLEHAYSRMLRKQLGKFNNNEQYSDVTIIINGSKFRCHKIILTSVSSYFEAMFSSGMAESQSSEVTIHDHVEPDIFKLVLDYMYTGQTELSEMSVQDLLKASNFLQIPDLPETCSNFIGEHVSTSNCFQLLEFADTLSLDDLYETVKDFIVEKFDAFGEDMDGIVILTKSLLIDLIKDDYLESHQEIEVFEVVMKWVEHDESRVDELGELCQYVRFPLLPHDYLLNHVSNNSRICKSSTTFAYVNEAIKYHMLPTWRTSNFNPRTRLRVSSQFSDVSYLLGLRSNAKGFCFEIFTFDIIRKRIASFATHKYFLLGAGVCLYNNSIYLSGGYVRRGSQCMLTKNILKYDISLKAFAPCKEMPRMRYSHTSSVVGNSMVVIGGRNTLLPGEFVDEIDQYDFAQNTWSTIPYAHLHFHNVPAVSFRDMIYVFGGAYNTKDSPNKVQSWENIFSFNLNASKSTDMFRTLCQIPSVKQAYYGKCVVANEQIFVMQSYGNSDKQIYTKYFLYSPGTDSIIKRGDCPYIWNGYDLVYYDGNVIVIGGKQCESASESSSSTNERNRGEENAVKKTVWTPNVQIHCYNIEEGHWDKIPFLKFTVQDKWFKATAVCRLNKSS